MLRHKFWQLVLILALLVSVYPFHPQTASATVVFSNFPMISGNAKNDLTAGIHKAVTFSSISDEVWQVTGISVILRQTTIAAPAVVKMELRNSDLDSTRGSLIADLGTINVSGTTATIYTFTPSGTIYLNPDQYYWIELYATSNFTDYASWIADNPAINPSTSYFQLQEYLFTSNDWTNSISSNVYNLIQIDATTIGTATPTNTPSVTDTPTAPPTCAIVVTAPILSNPVHRTHTTDTTPSFSWNSISGALSYRLMIYVEDRSFEYKKRTFNTTYTLNTAEALTPAKYLWRVRTQDTNCTTWTGWSTRNTLFVD